MQVQKSVKDDEISLPLLVLLLLPIGRCSARDSEAAHFSLAVKRHCVVLEYCLRSLAEMPGQCVVVRLLLLLLPARAIGRNIDRSLCIVSLLSMDVVDGQIIDTLLRLDPSFFDGLPEVPGTVTELDTETFYRAIVLLLWTCNPNLKREIPSTVPGQNMSAKLRCATRVVEAVKHARAEVEYLLDYKTPSAVQLGALVYRRAKQILTELQ
ncbi:unnamed protein product [Gongylonema pulchrum]|uniref:BAF250_C domain-containing protein n=1 Tax=Gongylonema pulchrum TaxID=637853 RepID=A0A183DNV9_9BILA|nr:unnamed protein product [Gongylonema pulchrum]